MYTAIYSEVNMLINNTMYKQCVTFLDLISQQSLEEMTELPLHCFTQYIYLSKKKKKGSSSEEHTL